MGHLLDGAAIGQPFRGQRLAANGRSMFRPLDELLKAFVDGMATKADLYDTGEAARRGWKQHLMR